MIEAITRARPRMVAGLCSIVVFLSEVTFLSAQDREEGQAAATGLAAADARRPQSGVSLVSAGSSIAMRGYSPVALVRARQWVKGREPFRVHFDGATYLLADERELQIFRAAPERYAPVFGGDCVVTFVKTGRRTPGLLRHGVVHEDRLYFFSSGEARQDFVDDPERYMNADVALDGYCPVCIVELNKAIPGRPELAAVLGGNRYFFPGAQQREMFLAQPVKYATAAHAIAGGPGGVPIGGTGDDARAVGGFAVPAAPQAEAMPSPAADEAETEPPSYPLAMAGYCPVAIMDDSRWVRGHSEYELVHDGRRYRFASKAHQQQFLDNPLKYVPALGGDCVVSYRDHGERIEGSVYHAIIHRGRQYLFPGLPQKEAFKQDPDAYADVDLALGGNCPVSLVDAKKEVAGKPEFTAWHDGMRYQMAGREQLEAFQAAPEKYAAAAKENP